MAEYERCKKDPRVVAKGPMPTTGRKMTHGEYWEACCRARGLVDDGDNGIKFSSDNASNGILTQTPVAVATAAVHVASRPSNASASPQQTSGNGMSCPTPLDVKNTFDALHALLGDNSQEGADGSSPWEPDPLPPSPSISSHSPRPKPVTNGANAVEANSSAVVVGGRRLPLFSSQDATFLSPLVCLMRSQLEIFSATEAEVETRGQIGGPVQKISVGRVGMRCVHCRDRPAAQQAKGAVSYPASIRMLNQATRNWQRFHWGTCQFIPPSAREEFERLQAGKKSNSTKKSKEYWVQRSGEVGLVDTAAIRTAASSPDFTSADSSGTDDERTIEPEGIYFEDDARKLNLRILLPSHSSSTKGGKKAPNEKEVGKNYESRTIVSTSQSYRSNKKKNTIGIRQIASGDAANYQYEYVRRKDWYHW